MSKKYWTSRQWMTSGIVEDDDGDELSALSMHGHEIGRAWK